MNPKDLPAGAAVPVDHDWIAHARSLTPLLDAAAPRIDASKGLPPDVQDALFGAKMFRMLLPSSLGGAELDLPTFFEVILAIAEGDASAAWCLVQNNGCAMSAAYLEPQAAREAGPNLEEIVVKLHRIALLLVGVGLAASADVGL